MLDSSSSEKIPFNRAFLWILLSTLLFSGSALMGWLYYLHIREKRLQDDQYRIVAIVQRTPQQESLKTSYLAEWLDLSLDQPINLYQFNTKEAERKLLACPLIKQATIQKIRPGTLYIQYHMRTPFAYLGDYANTALDTEGYIFPVRPFFTPKKLPVIHLGVEGLEGKWGSCLIEQERLKLAFQILKSLKAWGEESIYIKQIDVADAYADSYGQRQVVIALEISPEGTPLDESSRRLFLLRLNTEHYRQNLANFFVLRNYLTQWQASKTSQTQGRLASKPVIIDLRIPHLAFIKKEP